MSSFSRTKTASEEARRQHLKEFDLRFIKNLMVQVLQGHVELATSGVRNPDQNLRNILYDDKTNKIRLLDMGLAHIFYNREDALHGKLRSWFGLDWTSKKQERDV